MAVNDQTRTLILRAQDDDSAAAEALFERYRERLRAAVKRRLGHRYREAVGDSEDAVQDALLACFDRLEQFDYRGEGSFLAWLLRSADFQVRGRLRSLRTKKRDHDRQEALEGEPEARPDEPVERLARQEEERQLAEALDRLPPKERDVILLRRYFECDMPEICEELDLPSPGAARALLSRAQARLATLVGPAAPDAADD